MNGKYLFTGLAISLLLFIACAVDQFAGGTGEETTNGMVLGTLLKESNEPAGHTLVILLPDTSNPLKTGFISAVDTTDKNGNYVFSHVKPGTYNVQALNLTDRTRALVAGIRVQNDTIIAPADTIREPGFVKVTLTPGLKAPDSYIYIPGTTMYTLIDTLDSSVLLDSVPAGILPSINHGVTTSSLQSVIRFGLPVISKDTVVVAMASWQRSGKVFLNTGLSGADIAEDVYNFPVLIRLAAHNFNFAEAKSNGEDLRFTKADNTPLSHEIEQWDPKTQKAAIWVNVDTIYGNSSDRFILMYWANQDASDMSSSIGVFDTAQGFAAAWHLNSNCLDATAGGNNGTSFGATDTVGLIGHAKKFDGTDSIRVPGLAGTPPSITLSAWASLAMAGDSGSEVVSVGNAALLRMDDTRFNNTWGTMASFHTNNTHYDFGSGQFHAKTGWHHIAFTIDNINARQYFYVDGVLCDSGSIATPIDYTGVGQNILFGSRGENSQIYSFAGLIDEVRISRIAYSHDYIKLCFMNQKRDDALVVYE